MADRYDFVTVGDNCIDRFQDGSGLGLVGGNALNVSAQLSLLGHRVAYFGAVGDDDDGRAILQVLEKVGVCTDHVRVTEVMTAYSLVRHDENGDRDIYFEEFGASGEYIPTDDEIEIICQTKHVHIGWLRDGSKMNARLSSDRTTLSRDLSVNASAADLDPSNVDVAVLSASSETEANVKASELIQSGADLAIVTMGAQGSLAFDGVATTVLAANAINVVDTTGAGDAFIAGFLSQYKQDNDIKTSLEHGRAVATRACLHIGGFPQ